MKARVLAPAGILLLVFIARAWLAGAGSTPDGQPALVDLQNTGTLRSIDPLKAEFNRAPEKMRVIILLAPSCPYCLKGATAIERILSKHRDYPVVILNVWQPILATDWGKPGTAVLHRLADPRVRQFWDAEHRVARALEQSSEGRTLQPGCCFQNGIWWDLMAVYPPGAQWGDTLPEPILLEGTVDDAAPAFEALLTKPSGVD
jgi:hypothetical protein